ncbi:hypothetical protein ACP70R_015114 [Stipagrostis hirtigluma subsp. patula]
MAPGEVALPPATAATPAAKHPALASVKFPRPASASASALARRPSGNAAAAGHCAGSAVARDGEGSNHSGRRRRMRSAAAPARVKPPCPSRRFLPALARRRIPVPTFAPPGVLAFLQRFFRRFGEHPSSLLRSNRPAHLGRMFRRIS